MREYFPRKSGCLVTLLFILLTGVAGSAEGAGMVRLRYNDNNRISEILGPGQRRIQLSYSPRGRIQTLVNGTTNQQYEYTKSGLLQSVTDHTGKTGFKYDARGQLLEMTSPEGETVRYAYDASGRIAAVTWENRHFLRYQRDLLGHILTARTPAGDYHMQYDYNKGLMQRTYPNGAISLFQYNQDGRPVLIQHAMPDRRVFLEFSYRYDDFGYLISAIEKSLQRQVRITYSYDAFGQLRRADYDDGRSYQYEYDPFGNRLKTVTPSGQTAAVYGKNDALTSFNTWPVSHDAAGNVTAIGPTQRVYNDFDLLIADPSGRYDYNALGMRVAASTATGQRRFLHLMADLPCLLAETGKKTTRYIWADRQVLGQIDDHQQPLFYFEDQLGSIRAVMDPTGKMAGYAEYTPFGQPIHRIAGIRFGYAGEEQDETGKVYLRARYYLPEIGRFLSKDPMLPQVGDQVKQNRYAYAANSPLTFTDRNGAHVDAESRPASRTTYSPVSLPAVDPEKYSGPVFTSAQNRTQSDIPIRMQVQMQYNDFVNASARNLKNHIGTHSAGQLIQHVTDWTQFAPNTIGPVSAAINPGSSLASRTLAVSQMVFPKALAGVAGPALVYSGVMMMPTPISLTQALRFPLFDAKGNIRSIEQTIQYGYENKIWARPIEYAPSNLGRTMTTYALNYTAPNVGGVYLDQAAEVIGKLAAIQGVAFDRQSNRLILLGPDSQKVGLPPMQMDDFAAAFGSVFGRYDTEPGVTIDPDPENPKADQMIVRFFGGMENTHFGMVLFESDRLMKALSLGQDNLTRQKVAAHVKGYHNLLDLGFSDIGGQPDKELWSRFWLVPEQIPVKISKDRTAIVFPDTRIRVKTETMRWHHGKLVPAGDEKDDKAEYFAAHFTKYYDAYAKEFPVYAQLRQLTQMVGLAKWIKDAGIPIDMTWLQQYADTCQTPTHTPSLTVSDKRRFAQGNHMVTQQVSVFGGSDLTVNNVYLEDDGTVFSTARQARQAVAGRPAEVYGAYLDKVKQTQRVVALPTSQTRAAGAKMLSGRELDLVGRMYCSFHNQRGAFGHSWFFDLPVLHIRQPHRGKKAFLTSGKTKVLVQQFHLAGPFGIPDVRFENHAMDAQYGRVAFLPDRRTGFRGLYPDHRKMEYRLEQDDGGAMIFDSRGRIIRREVNSSDELQYRYDGAGRLVSAELRRHGATVQEVRFSYNVKGYISSATRSGETITYTYDENDHLVNVHSKKETVGYDYDARHLVISIHVNGRPTLALTYDRLGRVLSEKEGNGHPVNTEIVTANDQYKVTRGTNAQKVTWIFDGSGKLMEMDDASNGRFTWTYHDSGQPEKIKFFDRFGDLTTLECSADGRQVVATDPEQNSRTWVMDEFGRMRRIAENGVTVVQTDYGMTDKGWLESTETPDVTMQTLYTAEGKPAQHILSAKVGQGGQLLTTNTFASNGSLHKQAIQGLIQQERLFQDGRLATMKAGETTTTFSYFPDGRIQKVASQERSADYAYDIGGALQSCTLRQGHGTLVQRFENGQLVERDNGRGLKDVFQYDSEGWLQSVRRNIDARHGGEQWDLQRDRQSLKFLRNGELQAGFIWDEKNRLTEIVY